MALNPVAVVVPLSTTATLTADEDISLRHLERYLGKYDKYFLMSRLLHFQRRGFGTVRMHERYFGSGQAHARLQVAEEFYERFRDYKYILMYHLDALALSDQLLQWCASDLDYIGAPWLHCDDSPWVTHDRVGNSGFTLIKVESALEVMRSTRRSVEPDEYWNGVLANVPPSRRWVHLPVRLAKRARPFNNVRWEMRRWHAREGGTGNSDYFWSDRAVKYWPQFRVASVETGLKFAFEVAPRLCYQRNNYQLPFGCHAWPRYDRAFWEPYLLK